MLSHCLQELLLQLLLLVSIAVTICWIHGTLKKLDKFQISPLLFWNGGFATLGSTLALESATQNMLHVENVAQHLIHKLLAQVQIIDIDELGSKLLDV